MLKNRRILLGISGGIAVYKACDLVQRLKEQGAVVRAAMTFSAAKLVEPRTFAALTGSPVLTDPWQAADRGEMLHIELARWAEIMVVAPCTAHTLAELSLGLAGSPVSTAALAFRGPLIVAPAMNTVMLEAPQTQENIQRLRARGVWVLPTANGNLACGEVGIGKLLTPEEITSYIDIISGFTNDFRSLKDVKVLISGGHTEEPLDGVRFLSNRSSGKTAIALARAFHQTGAKVSMVLGKTESTPPEGMPVTRVATSAEFREAMLQAQADAQVVIMAAAIADFVPAETEAGKWKNSSARSSIALKPSANILEELGRNKPAGQILVGFALETENPVENALGKMRAKKCDLMVVNNPLTQAGLGFGEDSVEAAVLDSTLPNEGSKKLALLAKSQLALDLIAAVSRRLPVKAPA